MGRNIAEYLISAVEACPDKVAFADDTNEKTYRDLLTEAKRIAGCVNAVCYGSNYSKNRKQEPVIIFMPDGTATISSIFGVAYSGNYYTVVAPDQPFNYVEKIITSLSASTCITDIKHADIIRKNTNLNVVIYEEAIKSTFEKESIDYVSENDICCVIYTSGSTGAPKGVVITHEAIMYKVDVSGNRLLLRQNDIFAAQIPLPTAIIIYVCLAAAKKITYYIVSTISKKGAKAFVDCLVEKQITYLDCSPGMMTIVSNTENAIEYLGKYGKLHTVVFGGDSIPSKTFKLWKNNIKDCAFMNLYGSTEMIGMAIGYLIDNEIDENVLPIGKPLPGVKALLLDTEGQIKSDYESGELVIQSKALSIGYLGNKEETDLRFITCTREDGIVDTMYRTGDLVKYDENRNLVFAGRNDNQIEHHGHRVELEGVERLICKIDNVSECGCLYDEDRKQIIAIYSGKIVEMELHRKAHDILPQYMLPACFVRIDNFPHNENGKIDREKVRELWEKEKG